MTQRVLRWVVVPTLLLLLAWAFVADWNQAQRLRTAAEAESFAILNKAQTPAELREAVGHLGIVFESRSGWWIAIRYRDSHASPGWSSAVARDSDGGWFVSNEHFCGRFKMYQQLRERDEQAAIELRAIEEAANLEAARAKLITLGFKSVPLPELGY